MGGTNPSFGRESVVAKLGENTLTSAGASPGPGREFVPAEEKYEIEAVIGAGGMGEVLLVQDRDLRRQVAMKVIRPESALGGGARLKFVAEAQATSQLEHPGVPPVHDIGLTPEGRVYFTMKLVRGRTLREILKDLLLGVKEAKREYTLHRLLTVLERVCEAVHFAHEKGVIHRDLKPENIMLGSFGEVHVMDWGIARRVEDEELDTSERIATSEDASPDPTMDGQIKGTLPYLSPEQTLGRSGDLDRRSDVYALGCMLYEVLTLHRAFDGKGHQVLERIRSGDCIPVQDRNSRRPVPQALAELCRRAMAVRCEDRPPTAKAFGEGLREWLDGTSERERRHSAGERLAADGEKAASRYFALREEIRGAERAVEGLSHRFRPWEDVDRKAPLLEGRQRVKDLRSGAARVLAEAMRLLDGALLQEEGNRKARSSLAEIWRVHLEEAEAMGDAGQAAYAVDMIRRFDDGRLARLVAGTGSLFLASEPSDAEVTLVRLEDRGGRLRPGEERSLGRTPVGPVELPMGSYDCVLRLRGYPDHCYPVRIARNRSWSGNARLRREGDAGEGFLLVPGGPFLFGDGRDMRVMDLPDFAIQERPVTFADYCEFLSGIGDEQGAEAAAARVPGTAADGPFVERRPDGTWNVLPIIVDGPSQERWTREFGADFALRMPVLGVSSEDAEAYCMWRTLKTRREWRLPTEEEFEKAARGVDGRKFPWGDLEDASLGKCRDSREEAAQPEPVGTFPAATSIYGMVDATGNAWQWTSSWFDETKRLRVIKSGGWRSPVANLRCAQRQGYDPTVRLAVTGFRCARGLEG